MKKKIAAYLKAFHNTEEMAFFIRISFFILEIFTFLYYAN